MGRLPELVIDPRDWTFDIDGKRVEMERAHWNVLRRSAKWPLDRLVTYVEAWEGIDEPPARPPEEIAAQTKLREYVGELRRRYGLSEYLKVDRGKGVTRTGPIRVASLARETPRAKLTEGLVPEGDFLLLGNTTIPWIHVDGDFNNGGYSRHHINTEVLDRYWHVPPDARPFVDAIEQIAASDAAGARPLLSNGHIYRLAAFRAFRDSLDAVRLDLTFQPTRYYSMLATDYSLDLALADGSTLRSRYIASPSAETQPTDHLSHGFSVGVNVVTSDGYGVFAERSSRLAVSPGVFNVIGETSQHGRDAGDPYITAEEGAREELSAIPPERIRFLAFGLDVTIAQWSLHGTAQVDRSRDQVEALRNSGSARDARVEHARLHFVTWSPEEVAAFMSIPDREWLPGAIAGTYYALVDSFGEDRVAAAFAGKALAIRKPHALQQRRMLQIRERVGLVGGRVQAAPRAPRVARRRLELEDDPARYLWDGTRPIEISPSYDGWTPDQLSAELTDGDYRFERRDARERYLRYLESLLAADPQFQDGTKVMPSSLPRTSTDAPRMHLSLRRCRYTEGLFSAEVVAADRIERTAAVDALLRDRRLTFPCSLGLHLLLLTSDDHVLLTKGSEGKHYFPDHWSASIEEQIKVADLDDRGYKFTERIARRALPEELGLREPVSAVASALRLTSVVLDENAMYVALCAYSRLPLTAGDLRARWSRMRITIQDRHEITEIQLVPLLDVLGELKISTRLWHPTSRHRIAMAVRAVRGPDAVADAVSVRG